MINQILINQTLFIGIAIGIVFTGLSFSLLQKFNIHTLDDLKNIKNSIVIIGIITLVVGLPFLIPTPIFLDHRWLANPIYFLGLLLVFYWIIDLE